MTPETDTAGAALGVDVGGTFTDAVLIAKGNLYRAKILTTGDQAEGVMAAVNRVMGQAGIGASTITQFAHGMTTATNALLERKGARTVSVTTDGFRDLLEIGRQNRPRLYDPCPQRPETLIPRESRLVAHERVTPVGTMVTLDEDEVDRIASTINELAPESVAVCLLFSFANPAHERRLGERLRQELPQSHISLSSEVLPQFREYERLSTTAVDAYLTPLVKRYLENLGQMVADQGLMSPTIMQSTGGVRLLKDAAASAAPLLLSGPAAGVVGAAFAGERSGVDNLIAFDMGGTSTDVSLVREGAAETTTGTEIGGCPVALPMIDIHTIGAGGGSIVWLDAGGALRVGPGSAGATPGPACYGKGGADATVTDANMCLGYLGARLGGSNGLRLDRAAAENAIDRLAAAGLGLSREETALGVRRVANAEMVKALRVISVERGHDPRRFVLVAFGGAGPMHAADLASDLGISRVLVPDSCGVLSAMGMVVGDQRRDWVRTVLATCGWDETQLEEAYGELERNAAVELTGGDLSAAADVRYRGQSHELTVPVERPVSREQVTRVFEAEHERVYGYRAEGEEVELVNIRLAATIAGGRPELQALHAVKGEPSIRPAFFGTEWLQVQVWHRAFMGGKSITGPAVIEEDEATTVVPPGWRASVDDRDNLWLER